tara:strand:+ start:319 stop:498 length:180 start_codon:yes stop_codon:yes gene_type:complete
MLTTRRVYDPTKGIFRQILPEFHNDELTPRQMGQKIRDAETFLTEKILSETQETPTEEK